MHFLTFLGCGGAFCEACQQRMGVGIVGPSGCGKSTMWRVLEHAYKKQGKKYVVHVSCKLHSNEECTWDAILFPTPRHR
eukprot:1359196-Amphidinium_carterae.1